MIKLVRVVFIRYMNFRTHAQQTHAYVFDWSNMTVYFNNANVSYLPANLCMLG